MTTYLVSCPDCGSRIEVDRQTMRAVRGCRACGATGAHFCPGHPSVRGSGPYTAQTACGHSPYVSCESCKDRTAA